MIAKLVRKTYFKVAFNVFFIGGAVYSNYQFQVFCNPSSWAGIVLLIVFSYTILRPILKDLPYKFLVGILDGISFCTFLYCFLFLHVLNFIAPLTGEIFGLLPGFYLIVFLKIYSKREKNKNQKLAFRSVMGLTLLFVVFISMWYRKVSGEILQGMKNPDKEIPMTFMSEKILGMHFKYHTAVNLYDGWRPPIHEPILVIGYKLNGRMDPIRLMSKDRRLLLKDRIKLYHNRFPQNKLKQDCSCAQQESTTYFNDPIWAIGE